MEPWIELEVEYARRLREASAEERRTLYAEAYSRVGALRMASMHAEAPEHRTAGTYPALAERLASFCRPSDRVLEIGCGRGYTCLKLAPHVRSIVGLDVSAPALEETRAVLLENGIENVELHGYDAQGLTAHFEPSSFDKAISIELIEHLHPEDCRDHYRQVYEVLRPGGQYFIVTPSRVNGPHDISREVDPQQSDPIGFHLNETSFADIRVELRRAGFRRLRMFFAFGRYGSLFNWWCPPAYVGVFLEQTYKRLRSIQPAEKLLRHFVSLKVAAEK